MPIKIALIISVILQFGAAIIAISLTKRTTKNIAWWLISAGFLLMAFRRVFEIMEVFNLQNKFTSQLLSSWTGVLISIFMLLSLVFIKRIFNIQKEMDELREQNEAKILSAIIKTEETERQNFAKELHDGLGPLLATIKMSISSKLQKENANDKILLNSEKLIDESVATIKEVSNKLSPHVLNNFGLLKAIKSFIQKLNLLDSPKIKLTSNIGQQRFSYNIEVVLYRVTCELVTNSLKHAEANNIYIDLNFREGILTLNYIDDGNGFDINLEQTSEKGLGYSNIKSRIKSLNGNIEFYSQPGEGVRATIEIKTTP